MQTSIYWSTSGGLFSLGYFIYWCINGVLIVTCSFVPCVHFMLLFALYFLWMGSHLCLLIYKVFFWFQDVARAFTFHWWLKSSKCIENMQLIMLGTLWTCSHKKRQMSLYGESLKALAIGQCSYVQLVNGWFWSWLLQLVNAYTCNWSILDLDHDFCKWSMFDYSWSS